MTTQSPSHDDISQLARAIQSAGRTINNTIHRQLTDIRRFDRVGGWKLFGAKSCAHWLTLTLGLAATTARERVRVARALDKLELVDAALGDGVLSFSKTRALSRVATPDNEAMLLEMTKKMSNSELERFCRALRTSSTPHTWQERFVRKRSITGSGMVRIEIQLESDEAETVWAALLLGARRAARSPRATKEARGGAATSTRYPAKSVVAVTEIPMLTDALHQFACQCVEANKDDFRDDTTSDGAHLEGAPSGGEDVTVAASVDHAGIDGAKPLPGVEQEAGGDPPCASRATSHAALHDVAPCTAPAPNDTALSELSTADAAACMVSTADAALCMVSTADATPPCGEPLVEAAPRTLASTLDGIGISGSAWSAHEGSDCGSVIGARGGGDDLADSAGGSVAETPSCAGLFTSRGEGPPSARE